MKLRAPVRTQLKCMNTLMHTYPTFQPSELPRGPPGTLGASLGTERDIDFLPNDSMFIPDLPHEDHWCKHEAAMRACAEVSDRPRALCSRRHPCSPSQSTQSRGSLCMADEFRLILAGEWIYLKLESPYRHTSLQYVSTLAYWYNPTHWYNVAHISRRAKVRTGCLCRYHDTRWRRCILTSA